MIANPTACLTNNRKGFGRGTIPLSPSRISAFPLLPLILFSSLVKINDPRDKDERREPKPPSPQSEDFFRKVEQYSGCMLGWLPYMTSAVDGGGGPQKADERKEVV